MAARSFAFVVTTSLALAGIAGASDEARRPEHPWQLVDRKHWQIASDTVDDIATTDAAERTNGACGAGMVEVAGRMKTDGPVSVESLQETTCTDWVGEHWPRRCFRFDRDAWIAASASLATRPMRFCIDRFEHPNRRGAFPLIYVTWLEAREMCVRAQKRLCTEDEWTFACEGEEALPYPYGYDRDDTACVIDRPHRAFVEERLLRRASEVAMLELDRLWQGERSGTRSRCRSVFGVYDQTGNVDEWTMTSSPGGRRSILKGGYWGPIRARCRPSTRAHGEDYAFYQQGVRCCADTPLP